MSESEDDSQKTEDPTRKKLDESRKKGQVALSREVNNWIMLLAATLLVILSSGGILSNFRDMLYIILEQSHALHGAPGGIGIVLKDLFLNTLSFIAFPLIILMIAAFIGPFLQVGPLYAPESIKPELSKISIIKGFGRLFSKRAIMELLKGVLKICLIGFVGFLLIKPYFGQIEHFVGLPIPYLLDDMMIMIKRMMIGILAVLMIIAVGDYTYQYMEHFKKLRMSKQEIKDEFRQSEGDPHVKSKLRQLRSERSRQRMMQAVPSADVVITNPTHFAIALKYDPDTMEAPQCVAKGVDEVALRIREIAKENNVVVYEAPPLARALYDLVDLEEYIPSEHYKAVAEIITFVFKKKGKM
jgi:flagellar biosynthetic protein FlhB